MVQSMLERQQPLKAKLFELKKGDLISFDSEFDTMENM